MRDLVHEKLDMILRALAFGDVGHNAHQALSLAVGCAGNNLTVAP